MIEINNQFILKHDRLVRVIVNQFKVANVDPEDLMQEGRIGLIEAAKRFDPNRGIQFSSYASWWIEQEALTYADLLTTGECIEDVIIRREERTELHNRLKRMIHQLPAIDQQVICALYGFEEDSVEEATLAERLHCSPLWVHRVHLRALEQLRRLAPTYLPNIRIVS